MVFRAHEASVHKFCEGGEERRIEGDVHARHGGGGGCIGEGFVRQAVGCEEPDERMAVVFEAVDDGAFFRRQMMAVEKDVDLVVAELPAGEIREGDGVEGGS